MGQEFSMSENIAVIVAAGRGIRCAGDAPKQYKEIAGKAMLLYSIELCKKIKEISRIILVVNEEHQEFYQDIVALNHITDIVYGGATRAASVVNALKYAKQYAPKNILIHDGARPFVTAEIIKEGFAKLKTTQAAIPVIKVADSVKQLSGRKLVSVARDELYLAQTPQFFVYDLIANCAEQASSYDFTDEAQLVEQSGYNVEIFPGSLANYKITTAEDLERARRQMQQEDNYRTAFGYDLHKLSERGQDAEIMLGGVAIKHDQKIIAHSDGDVLLHALTDALLGAAALGDIGEHFPDSDPQYKGKNSKFFVQEALAKLKAKNFKICNLDSLIICEQPAITPHKAKIKANLAKLLNLTMEQVNIKATTHEGCDALGKQEAIAAQVNILVKQA